MKTLLRVPDLVEAIRPLVDVPVSAEEMFRLIGTGDVRPLGYIHRIPVFDLSQIAVIVEIIKSSYENGV